MLIDYTEGEEVNVHTNLLVEKVVKFGILVTYNLINIYTHVILNPESYCRRTKVSFLTFFCFYTVSAC